MAFKFFTKKEPVNSNEVLVKFNKGEEVSYKEAEGFFLFKDEIFYKPKNGTGRSIKTSMSFMDYYLSTSTESDGKNPIELRKMTSSTMVTLLKI